MGNNPGKCPTHISDVMMPTWMGLNYAAEINYESPIYQSSSLLP